MNHHNNNDDQDDLTEEFKDPRMKYIQHVAGDAGMQILSHLKHMELTPAQTEILNALRELIIEQKAYKPILFLEGNVYKDATEDASLSGQLCMLDMILLYTHKTTN